MSRILTANLLTIHREVRTESPDERSLAHIFRTLLWSAMVVMIDHHKRPQLTWDNAWRDVSERWPRVWSTATTTTTTTTPLGFRDNICCQRMPQYCWLVRAVSPVSEHWYRRQHWHDSPVLAAKPVLLYFRSWPQAYTSPPLHHCFLESPLDPISPAILAPNHPIYPHFIHNYSCFSIAFKVFLRNSHHFTIIIIFLGFFRFICVISFGFWLLSNILYIVFF